MADNRFFTKKIFDEIVIPAGGSINYDQDLGYWKTFGHVSLHIVLVGTGTAKFTYESSNTGKDFVVAEGAADILAAMTVGTELVAFDPKFAKHIRFVVEETGGANSVTVTVVVAAQ